MRPQLSSSSLMTIRKSGEISSDIVRLLDVLIRIERRRQARLRSLPKKESC